ncbi:ATP-binding protein [Hydrogenophaga sp.]|uniref:hybrid sensor histidine kinase/response regulator n=1 Tax=Hydrogenophaga sp. TaxID=1904254 RepID=UPI0027315AF1|nr:ATP-binding protein [Hydrogenophaga sp.]MDP2017444.1 response regulator [Hydrogenophaga sp.]MDP3164536.1 response regulator [Hydrogenophaga sp.]
MALLLVVITLASLNIFSIQVLSAVRAYVSGESLWSKGQKDASFSLLLYADAHHPEDLARFELALAIPLGDRIARQALDAAVPDRVVARQGFLQGRNQPDDIQPMIDLFLRFRNVGFMARTIAIWEEGDAELDRLVLIAEQLRSAVRAGSANSEFAALREQLLDSNARLTVLAQRFSDSLGVAARSTQRIVAFFTLGLSLVLAVGGSLLVLTIFGRVAKIERSLRDSNDRWTMAARAAKAELLEWDLATDLVTSHQVNGTRTIRYEDFLASLSEEDRPRLTEALAQARTTQSTFVSNQHMRGADGTEVWMDFIGQFSYGDDGKPYRLIGVRIDTTDRVNADTTRRELLEQLRQSQKMESLGTLAGGIAHDFNNIVAAILGNVVLAREDLKPDDPACESIDQINKAALRARDLVRQILAFSRQQPPKLVDQALQPIVLETLQLLRATLPASVVLESNMPDEPIYVRVDATQIEQVLMNLCTNAWHASKLGEARVVIGVEKLVIPQDREHPADGLTPGPYAHLSVSDDGVGMDAATRARIFEPFFTTRRVGEGTGLGLSVVHGIVIAHAGAITVDSEVGRGSSLHVYLPLQRKAAETRSETPVAVSGLLRGQGEHILYIDDEELMILMVDRLLHRAGYRVTAVQDPHAALEAFKQDPYRYDLVLSDFNMPDMSGLQVARAVGLLRPELPVVIISGDISEELHDEAAQLGVSELLPKQDAFDQLVSVVHRVLAVKKWPRKSEQVR